jgi:hypothetical protein
MMGDPPRLLDGDEVLTADERRALSADAALLSPLGAKGAVWSALGVKLSAAAATTSAGAVALSGAAKLSALSLLKAAGIGVALGSAVSTGMYFGTLPERAPQAPVVVTVPSAVAPSSAERTTGSSPFASGPAPSSIARAPEPTAGSPPRSPNVGSEPDRAPVAPPASDGESQRVARARAFLRSGDAARSLQELHALERDEPSGLLAQEREALHIEALSALGRREEARARAGAFLKRYPTSPHVRAVRRAAE